MDGSGILITGAGGQLGKALSKIYPNATKTDSSDLDITDTNAFQSIDWGNLNTIINAAGYTNVDAAETPEGKQLAWAVNDKAVGNLADIAAKNNLLLVHVSTAYVFDGRQKVYKENDQPQPLGEYAKSKAAGEEKAQKAPKHYVVRTDSVIGDGKNFVRAMLDLGKKGVAPTVVADQIIRPTFTGELAGGIKFLIDKSAPYGIYNLTNEGGSVSWANFTREIFKAAGINLAVTDTTLKEYSASKPGVAPRPLNSVLDLTKIESIGFTPKDWREDLSDYVKREMQ